MSTVTAATWVPRGFAAPFPTKYDFDEQEFERIAEIAKLQLEDAEEDLQEAQKEESQATSGKSSKDKKKKKEDDEYVLTFLM
jgi:periodic tryptophan protein 1